eukprot:Pgem_evm1s5359
MNTTITWMSVSLLYTGVDTKNITETMYTDFILPFEKLQPTKTTKLVNKNLLTLSSSFLFDLKATYDDRYHVHNIPTTIDFSETDFFEETAQELDERLKIKDSYFAFQLYARGGKTEQDSAISMNKNKNKFPFRNFKLAIDDWIFFKCDSQADMIGKRLIDYKSKTQKYWHQQGDPTEIFLATSSVKAGKTTMAKDWKDYYPSKEWYDGLVKVKCQFDPCNVFRNDLTIPVDEKLCQCNN